METSTKSSARHLYALLNVDLVRDQIMDAVAPIDVVNLVIGTGIKFVTQDMKRYTSIVKYIIPNRRWLQSKIVDGYEFILVSKNLHAFINTNGYDIRRRISLTSRAPSPQHVNSDVVLIVVRNGSFVRCTHAFMDGSGAETSNISTHWPSTMELDGFKAYIMTVTTNHVRATLWCVDKDKPRNMPLIMDSNMIISSKLNTEKNMTKVEYMYLNTDGDSVIHTSTCKTKTQDETMEAAKMSVVLATQTFESILIEYRVHALTR